jgi:hypothetical protein
VKKFGKTNRKITEMKVNFRQKEKPQKWRQ